jgi:hypothetical protein
VKPKIEKKPINDGITYISSTKQGVIKIQTAEIEGFFVFKNAENIGFLTPKQKKMFGVVLLE